MASRSDFSGSSKRVEVSEEEIVVKAPIPETVQLVLLRDVNLKITGKHTGQVYFFPGAGSVLEVDKQDAQGFLLKTSGGCDCPGTVGATPYFQVR